MKPVRALADKDEIHLVIADALAACEAVKSFEERRSGRTRRIDELLRGKWNPHAETRGNR